MTSLIYQYTRPGLAVDVAAVAWQGDVGLVVLTWTRDAEPYQGWAALPGAFVRHDDRLLGAARRALLDRVGLETAGPLLPLPPCDTPDRDPRDRIISIPHLAILGPAAAAAALPAGTQWSRVDKVLLDEDDEAATPLAFDHRDVVLAALEVLEARAARTPVAFELLPERFSLTDVQRVYEALRGRAIDKRNFRRKLLAQEVLVDTGAVQAGVAHRAARLYRFDAAAYQARLDAGEPLAL
jgi:8-oxo-dGTP diphosphatase